ncbi:MAG TPA: hypothetical protein VKA60_13070 [Blastocatellia bacterium]|nr:hypothetical protein [Blastocatellia bacterium]
MLRFLLAQWTRTLKVTTAGGLAGGKTARSLDGSAALAERHNPSKSLRFNELLPGLRFCEGL